MRDIVLKSKYRKLANEKLAEIGRDYVRVASSIITDEVLSLPEIINSQNIFVYLSFSNEVETKEIIEGLKERGKNISVPKLINGEMFPVRYEKNMFVNKFGIQEPENNYIVLKNDVAIIPALFFDIDKNRLGRGKGYYDRFLLDKEIFKIGIGYDFQVIDKLPGDAFDIKMDKIITDKRIL